MKKEGGGAEKERYSPIKLVYRKGEKQRDIRQREL